MLFRSPDGATVLDTTSGALLARVPPGGSVRLLRSGDGTRLYLKHDPRVRAAAVRVVPRRGLLAAGGHRYRGALEVFPAAVGVTVVHPVRLETYLEGVVPGEIPRGFALEAQKALAVAARTYAIRQLGKHAADGYDLCDSTHCQRYLGVTRASPRALQAVRSTRGLCVWYGSDLAYTFYSADCGGSTTAIADVPLPDAPATPVPYLRPVRDRPAGARTDYCQRSPYRSWSARIAAATIEAALNADPATAVGRLTALRFADRDASGRVRTVIAEGRLPAPEGGEQSVQRTLTGWELRRRIGPTVIRSTLAWIERLPDGDYRIRGRGYGHGLGLCQIGANGMAAPPYRASFRRILQHYYPGVRIATE